MADSTNRSVRILVVDSDADSGQRICDALTQEGYAAEYSSSAGRALTMARREEPSVMIVDTHLDGCSGYEFANAIQAEYSSRDIPVIFTSNQARDADDVERSRTAGGMYFLSKPIDVSVMLELVDKSLWMPHLVRRHIENQAHDAAPKSPRMLKSDVFSTDGW